jgi:hypothetical protein
MASKPMGPDALAGAHGAGNEFRERDSLEFSQAAAEPQARSLGAIAAATAADPTFRHKALGTLRSDRLKLEFNAKIAVLFGREPIEAVLDRFETISEGALVVTGGDQVPPRVAP